MRSADMIRGQCRACILYDLEKELCGRYNMISRPDQTCKSFDGGGAGDAGKKVKIRKSKSEGWDIGF